MNKSIVCAAAMVLATVTGTAQSDYFTNPRGHSDAKMRKAEPQYCACLGSENEGVVESALAHAVWMKLCSPERSFENLQARISSLASTADSPTIRYKAYVASLVFDRPDLFKGEKMKTFEDGDALFSALNARLQIVLLSSPNTKYLRGQ